MRIANLERVTNETEIKLELNIDGKGEYDIRTPIKFLNHMLESFTKHGLFDMFVVATGDLEIDQHHTIEDIGLVLGKAFKKALDDKIGINRAGFFIYPMDDALATVSVDLSGRSYLIFKADFKRRYSGDLDTDLIEHFFEAIANSMGANIVVKVEFGKNDHHKLEAIFKAFAKAMSQACSINQRITDTIPSTKGVIDN